MTSTLNGNTSSRGLALVVDDDEVVRMFVVSVLTKMGFAVKTAPDGMAALQMCELDVFDIVICDMRMPKLSGISFLKNVRMRSPGSADRIIFVSSLDDPTVKRESFEAGAQDYLVKPISTSILANAIGKLSI